MKQIVLITDGCSNEGINPVVAAAHARRQGIVVNVIGIVDGGDLGERGAAEVAEIARAGGGMSRTVHARAISETVQMMTRKTVLHTIQQTVQQELRQLIGPSGSLEQLPPDQRGAIVRVIDNLSESAPLRVALLIDTSASMRPKLAAVSEACRDLLAGLQARAGKSEMCVLHFPGTTEADVLSDWTDDLAKAGNLFYNLNMKGTTPTGPALMHSIRHLNEEGFENAESERMPYGASTRAARTGSGEGIWSDYIV